MTYLALLRLPLWKALSKGQRRLIWRNCVHPILTCRPFVVSKLALSLLLLFVAYQVGGFNGLAQAVITIALLVFVIPELLDIFWVARHRRDVESCIQTHAAEIQSVV